MDDPGFAPPAFKPAEAVQSLRRELRALGLAERGGVFERRGVAVATLTEDADTLRASVVRRPSRSSPEWTHKALKSSADCREFTADLKRKLASWSDRDD